MNYLVLGSEIEYQQAVKRLEELADAEPGTLQAQERRELISLFVQFENHMKQIERHIKKEHKTKDSELI